MVHRINQPSWFDNYFFSIFNVKDFGAAGDGATDDTAAINAATNAMLAAGGGTVYFPDGDYLITDTLGYNDIVPYAEFRLADGATLVGSSSMAAADKMFYVLYTGSDPGYKARFKFSGGKFDGRDRPATPGSSSAPDLMNVNSRYMDHVEIRDVYFLNNDDQTGTAGDSCLFVASCENIIITGCHFIGAVDAGIYLSADSTQTYGENCIIQNNFFQYCQSVGLISKRTFRRYIATSNFFKNCNNGVATGSADTVRLPGIDLVIANNHFYEVTRPIMVEWADGATVTGNHIVDPFIRLSDGAIVGETAILIDGSSNCSIIGNTIQCRDVTPIGSSVGIRAQPRTVDVTTMNSTGNIVMGNVIDMPAGVPISESNSDQDNNFYAYNRIVGAATTVTLSGANSMAIVDDNTSTLTFRCNEMYFGGTSSSAALRVSSAASQVNRLAITGSAASAGSGVVISSEGSDSTVPITINPKGSTAVLIGGGAGSESLYVSKGTSGGNSIQVEGVAAGSSPVIRSRGADTHVNIKFDPKGSGLMEIDLSNVPTYADDAAAAAASLTAGEIYKTSTGQLMIKL